MKWFDFIKKRFDSRDLDVTDFNLPEPPHSTGTPDVRWEDRIAENIERKKNLQPIAIEEDGEECPPGELWCEQHQECESEKYWLTHNRHLTAEEVENQKQFESSGKLSDK